MRYLRDITPQQLTDYALLLGYKPTGEYEGDLRVFKAPARRDIAIPTRIRAGDYVANVVQVIQTLAYGTDTPVLEVYDALTAAR